MTLRRKESILIAIVLVLALVFGLTRWVLGSGRLEAKAHVEEGSVSDLTVRDSNAPVYLKAAQDGLLRIEYSESDFIKYDITRQGDELQVSMRDTRAWYQYLRPTADGDRRLTLCLPWTVAAVDIQTSNDDIELDSISGLSSLSASTSNSDVTLKNSSLSGHLFVRSSNGSIRLSDTQIGSAELVTSNGDIQLTRLSSQGSISAKASNAAIRLERLQANQGDIQLESSNGPIEGSILGRASSFDIRSSTSNAGNNLSDIGSGGPQRLTVRTSNGAIRVNFVQ